MQLHSTINPLDSCKSMAVVELETRVESRYHPHKSRWMEGSTKFRISYDRRGTEIHQSKRIAPVDNIGFHKLENHWHIDHSSWIIEQAK